jgi:hypothetical protein
MGRPAINGDAILDQTPESVHATHCVEEEFVVRASHEHFVKLRIRLKQGVRDMRL